MSPDPDAMAVKSQMKMLDELGAMASVLKPLVASPATDVVGGLADTIAELPFGPRYEDTMDEADAQMEVLRSFELHGDGLRTYASSLATAAPTDVQPGDVLVASDRTAWVVGSVDDKGKVTSLAGGSASSSRAKRQREVALVWRPSTSPRPWLATKRKQTAAPAYADLGAALVHLVRLWGQQWIDGRDLSVPAGWFLEILGAPGLKLPARGLDESADAATLAAFCEKRGGLVPVGDDTELTPGDVLFLAKGGIGVVTRVDAAGAGRPVDLLRTSTGKAGPIGEPAGAVQLVRDVAPSATTDRLWRPAKPS